MPALAAVLAILHASVATTLAAPPDLTSGGVPNEDPPITFNLGPTGARGWAYHVKVDTSESRQILVTAVDAGSPAAGVLAADDVILGADGTGANPAAFGSDARKSLAFAIADAEASSPATLKLLRWRAGSTTTVTLTLQTLGAYSATAPYNCPKSALILQNGLQYVYNNESPGRYSFGAITLLANGNPTYQAKAQTEARALIPSQATMDQMMSDAQDTSSMITWQRGHTLVFLAEYYLATGDTQVLPAIEAYAVNIAKNQSLFGTVGHKYANKWPDGSANGPMGGVYGVVNSAGMPCFLGVLLAKECGLTNPELDPAIEASSRFFAYYSGKGAIPYGEHEPYIAHESNGKSGLGALYFGLQTNRVDEGKFFAKMATASANEREKGHTGSWFNYLWAPLGAAQGGEEAAAAYFSRISWMLDLNRRWDGKFQYDCLNGEGHNNGSTWYDFRMSTAALLTYALPERKLRITGKGYDNTRWLSSADVTEAVEADDYDADPRSDSELISDLGNWSPKVRSDAAQELGTRSISSTELNQITAIANDTGASSRSRAGACLALGKIGNSSSSAPLAALLTDSDNYVRYSAGEAMRYLPRSANLVHVDTILAAAASTAQPLYPMVEEDPLHFAHAKLGMLLFYSWSAFGPKGILWDSVDGIDRNLLYPAIRAISETPVGLSRGTLERTYDNLTYADFLAVAGSVVDSITNRAPADKMFSNGVRRGGVAALRKHGFAEGVPACMSFVSDEEGGRRKEGLELIGTFGGSVHSVEPDPDAVGFLTSYLSDGETAATAQTALDAIAADTNPTPLVALKSIDSATADDSPVDVTANSTVLRVTATDHAQGDSVYTWQKLSGPGNVTFTPNGTAAAANSTVQFDGTLGTYQFEVTMSDSRGLTEAYETITVELANVGAPDLTPPTPDPMTWASAPAPASDGPVVHEDFDYTGGTELGDNGGMGFGGAWAATRSNTNAGFFVLDSSSLAFSDASSNDLPVSGNSAHRTNGTGRSEANRVLSSAARTELLADGSTMWFSVLHQRTTSNEHAGFVLGTGTFDVASGWQLDEYVTGGEGFGFGSSGNDTIGAISFDDSAGLQKVDSSIEATSTRLLAGKITWNANGSNDTLQLYNVTDLTTEPTTPIATVSADLDQSSFDRVSILSNKASAVFDEIRLGATFASVAGADGDSETSITMIATTASDPSGVEYYFTCTSGGGHDSGWQDSPLYTDTGLAPGTGYTYTVTVRDKSPNQNTSVASAPASATTAGTAVNPLKVFIMAGQSNMEGHGEMDPVGTQGTLEYLFANDPGTYGHLKDGGNWAALDDVWIWYKRGGTTVLNGDLSAGYGANTDTIGPELQFGHVMGSAYGEQVLIIKTAWGGKSLAVDFRPPTSGWSVNPPVVAGDQGYYYQEMLNYVSDVLTNLSTYFPGYNPANGYELAGFGWHQGWNDRVNQAHNDEYEANMENFINDVRSDLGAPGLPFVIATTGMSGWSETHPRALSLMAAQLAMEDFTTYPAFNGNVAVVETRDFWHDAAVSPADQSYHWNRNAKTYFQIGQAMALEMQALIAGDDTAPPAPNPATFASAPAADSDTAISMTATTGSDASGPVQYLFTETSGNAGGTSSDWQTNPSYTDSGLSPSTQYTYTVTMRDALGNTGSASAPANATTSSGTDTTPPTLAGSDIVDNRGGGPIYEGTPVIYTVTFSEAMDAATIQAADFENAGSPAATISSVSATVDPAVFEVSVTPGGVGTLQLRVKSGAALEDLAGNALVTAPAIVDDTIITVATAPSGVSILSFTEGVGPGGAGDKTIATGYDASAADKLVVVIGGEHGFPGNTGGVFNSVTYAGVALTEAVQEEAGVPTAAIFYLDDPGAAGDIVVNQENHNSSVYGIYQLIGTAAGVGASNKATTDSVSLTTTGAASLVIAGILDAGPAGGNGAPNLAANAPLTEDTLTDLEGGARYVSLSTGSATVASPGSGTYSFSNAGGTDLLAIVAAEFLSASAPPTVIVPNVVGLAQSAAESAITAANLTVGTVTTSTSGSVPAGDVISQNPAGGASVASGSAVDLVVSLGPPDTTPPTPNAATFAVAPTADSDTAISMTATTGNDPSGPVEYLFTETSGNPGGSSSVWQTSPNYTDSGLSAGTLYSYTVTMRDSLGNTGTASTPASATTTGGNDFSDWIALYPGVGGLTGFADDPDGDGIGNGLENFFGTRPDEFTQGLAAGAVTTGGGSTFFSFTHPQGDLADDLTAAYQWSTDLQAYHAGGVTDGNGTTVSFSTSTDTGITTVTATITGAPVPDRLFVRVAVTQN